MPDSREELIKALAEMHEVIFKRGEAASSVGGQNPTGLNESKLGEMYIASTILIPPRWWTLEANSYASLPIPVTAEGFLIDSIWAFVITPPTGADITMTLYRAADDAAIIDVGGLVIAEDMNFGFLPVSSFLIKTVSRGDYLRLATESVGDPDPGEGCMVALVGKTPIITTGLRGSNG
jgi:hypothetical protein